MPRIYRLILNAQLEFQVEDRNTRLPLEYLEDPGHRHGLARRLADSLSPYSTEGGFSLADVTVMGATFEVEERGTLTKHVE